MIVYFSGTGNSRYVAEILSEALGDETVDAGALLCRNETALLSSVRPWVFVCPVYGWRMPQIFSAWIEKGEFSGATDAYFLLTCGSDMGDAGKYLEKLCQKKGFAFCGAQEVVMPENYIANIGKIGETRTKPVEILPDQRVGTGIIDMIRNQHQITRRKI